MALPKLLLIHLYLCVAVFCQANSWNNNAFADTSTYWVTKVVDGDTFWVDDGSEKGLKIRLIGIDAPEAKNAFKKKKQPYGKASKIYLHQLIYHKKVRLEYDVSRKDRYARTLAYAYLKDGGFINALLVQNGYATVSTVPPNVKYATHFAVLQTEARNKKRGLWQDE